VEDKWRREERGGERRGERGGGGKCLLSMREWQVGIKRVADCNATAGEGCFYPSGARQYDIARKPCRPMSLFRPQESPYRRPPWRHQLDIWLGSSGEFGQWLSSYR